MSAAAAMAAAMIDVQMVYIGTEQYLADFRKPYPGSERLYYIDNPLTVFDNPDVTDGSVCIVIKESFGNALMPLLVDHYGKTYEIDYRYWKGNLIDYAKEVGATDIVFANNISMVSTGLLVGNLSKIIK